MDEPPMSLSWIPLLTIAGIFVPVMTSRRGRMFCVKATLVAPLLALALVLSNAPAVFSGDVVSLQIPWMPLLGLDLALRIDGPGLFSLLILGIGSLILYAGHYLSADGDDGRFLAYMMLFMTAMLGIVMADDSAVAVLG
ncbi:hypothetical protein DSL92_05915 [Billgrantia gudaonensis]|uniref:Uncharacterized protein n=1 Tax=Billgrantia gudaonensis TaxID=376427 RepID=A0A3S0QFY0_9GAMM|nr:hypothetical protein DSL92_05915 [Halomonas gudaonensis]